MKEHNHYRILCYVLGIWNVARLVRNQTEVFGFQSEQFQAPPEVPDAQMFVRAGRREFTVCVAWVTPRGMRFVSSKKEKVIIKLQNIILALIKSENYLHIQKQGDRSGDEIDWNSFLETEQYSKWVIWLVANNIRNNTAK